MIYVVAAIVAVTAFALVAYPLFRRKEEPSLVLDPQSVEVDDLHSRRDAAYAAIKELDFEYQLGNLSQADYQDLRSQYRQRAAFVLREMDELTMPMPQEPDGRLKRDDEIEEAARHLRVGRGKKTHQSRASGLFCPQCGAPIGRGDRFCAACGVPLAQRCPACREDLDSEDNFCSLCGAKVR